MPDYLPHRLRRRLDDNFRLLAGQADQAMACVRGRDGAAVVLTPGEPTPDGSVLRLWDLTSGDAHDIVLAGHTATIDILDCLRLHDDTPIVIGSGLSGGPVRAWEIDTGQPYGPPLPVDVHWRRALAGLQLPDGMLLAIILDNHGNLRVWGLHSGHPHGPRLAGPAETDKVDAVAAALLPDGTPVAVTAAGGHHYGTAGAMQVWDLATGRPHGQPIHLRTSRADALTCTRLPDGTAISAVGGASTQHEGGIVEIWDLATGRQQHEIAIPERIDGLHFTAEHRLVVGTYLDIAVYDMPRADPV